MVVELPFKFLSDTLHIFETCVEVTARQLGSQNKSCIEGIRARPFMTRRFTCLEDLYLHFHFLQMGGWATTCEPGKTKIGKKGTEV